jgi:hypothetical protein
MTSKKKLRICVGVVLLFTDRLIHTRNKIVKTFCLSHCVRVLFLLVYHPTLLAIHFTIQNKDY